MNNSDEPNRRNKALRKKIHALTSELTLYQKRCEQYEQAYDSLLSQIKELQRHRFGKKSERFIDQNIRS